MAPKTRGEPVSPSQLLAICSASVSSSSTLTPASAASFSAKRRASAEFGFGAGGLSSARELREERDFLAGLMNRLVPKDGEPDPSLSPWAEPLRKALGRLSPEEASAGSTSWATESPRG